MSLLPTAHALHETAALFPDGAALHAAIAVFVAFVIACWG